MLPITIEQLIRHLTEYVQQTQASVDLILVGGLALAKSSPCDGLNNEPGEAVPSTEPIEPVAGAD